MDSTVPFNLTIFTDSTKNVCMCSATSIIIIVLFVISPLSNFFKTSLVMKILALLLILLHDDISIHGTLLLILLQFSIDKTNIIIFNNIKEINIIIFIITIKIYIILHNNINIYYR